ncbi:hypothetical protein L596_022634 [Steinernema carpocapsae]|uniref:Uncharacterized protein n=1 Tax=Steinernema carpocapsae TaxID=34508 RepID=A0A4U5MNA7_STECR|nr:hypothetical protein L596_022634 [Steinernema carpocapsae]
MAKTIAKRVDQAGPDAHEYDSSTESSSSDSTSLSSSKSSESDSGSGSDGEDLNSSPVPKSRRDPAV